MSFRHTSVTGCREGMELGSVPIACPQPRLTLLKMSHRSMDNQMHSVYSITKETSGHLAVTSRKCYWDKRNLLFQKYCPSWAVSPFFLWRVFPCLQYGPCGLAHPFWDLEASVCSCVEPGKGSTTLCKQCLWNHCLVYYWHQHLASPYIQDAEMTEVELRLIRTRNYAPRPVLGLQQMTKAGVLPPSLGTWMVAQMPAGSPQASILLWASFQWILPLWWPPLK